MNIPFRAELGEPEYLSAPAPAMSSSQQGVAKVSTSLPEATNNQQPKPHRSHTFRTHHRQRSFKRRIQNNILERLIDSSSNTGTFWRTYKHLRYPGRPPDLVDLQQLYDCFLPRMNPPRSLPAETANRLETEKTRLADRPSMPSIFPTLNERFTSEDVERGKAHLSRSEPSKSRGADDVSYSWLLELDNDVLRDLLNACVDAQEVPTAWLKTLVLAIRKHGNRDFSVADSYRTVALESCVLKFLTLLCHMKLASAAEEAGIFPPSQNGFRPEFRTNNNAFVLRTIIEQTIANDETLYVAFVDISNAFPSTNQHRLWNKLYDRGLTGRYFDWLRALYEQMSYVIVHDGHVSEDFKALCGVLIGDPASPTLWNLFLSDLCLQRDPDDACLGDTVISHLEHADDIAIVSRTAEGLQRHLTELESWCASNFLKLDAGKSKVMMFGALPRAFPSLRVEGVPLEIVPKWPYVGVWFQSTTRDFFAEHYRRKMMTAMGAARSVLGCERLVGRSRLPPCIATKLYTALVDCYLISGADIALDVTSSCADPLFTTQKTFLRRVLGLPDNSKITPLFTETGLLPLQYRRVLLALRYLDYLINRPPDSYVYLALQACDALREAKKPSWLSDLDFVLRNLPNSTVALPALADLDSGTIATLSKAVRSLAVSNLENDVNSFHSLRFLAGRREPSEDGTDSYKALFPRHYLSQVKNFRHRITLTRLLCGTLTPSTFRASPGKPLHDDGPLQRDYSCRLCNASFESPEHVLLQCPASPRLREIRRVFRENRAVLIPALHPSRTLSDEEAFVLLKKCIFCWNGVALTAKFVHEATTVWRAAIQEDESECGSEGESGESDVDEP